MRFWKRFGDITLSKSKKALVIRVGENSGIVTKQAIIDLLDERKTKINII